MKTTQKQFVCLLTTALLVTSCAFGCGGGKDDNNYAAWSVKATAPTAETEGTIGDMWLDTAADTVYQMTESGWINYGTVQGENPVTGKDGAGLLTGAAAPLLLDISGKAGSMYVNTTNGSFYRMDKTNGWEFAFTVGTVDTDIVDASWYADGELKILMVGNSFSDDTSYHLWKVAYSAGVDKVTVGNLYIPGCSLETHLENVNNNAKAYEYRLTDNSKKGVYKTTKNVTSESAVKSQDWDFISFQQVSDQSGRTSGFTPLNELISWATELCPSAKIVWNMTWAYQADSTHAGFKNYDNDQMKMYNAIVAVVQAKVSSNAGVQIISPTGTAIQNVRTALGDTATRDGYHLAYEDGMDAATYNSRYLAALTFFGQLSGVSLDKVTYAPSNVDAQTKAVMLASAKAAILTPFAVTQITK